LELGAVASRSVPDRNVGSARSDSFRPNSFHRTPLSENIP
jgi:hypothetical protein